MTIITFIKMNPLLSAVLALVLCGAIYFGFNTLYAAGRIAILDHANKQLDTKNEKIKADNQALQTSLDQSNGVIAQQIKELEQKDALLQAVSTKVINNKQALDDAVNTANRIRNDDSPMSRDDLKQKLCELYNIAPAGCQ